MRKTENYLMIVALGLFITLMPKAHYGQNLIDGSSKGPATIDVNCNATGTTVNAIPKVIEKTSSIATISNSAITDLNGNIGIGNTNPSEKLDVNGTIKATSFIKLNFPFFS